MMFSFPPDDRRDQVVFHGQATPSLIYRAAQSGFYATGLEKPASWTRPSRRAIVLPAKARMNTSLRRYARRFEVSMNTHFNAVLKGCAAMPRAGDNWLTPAYTASMRTLHSQGRAGSVGVWRDDELVGGVFGLCLGEVFSTESFFRTQDNASKVAAAALHVWLADYRVVDHQELASWKAQQGVVDVPASEYAALLHTDGGIGESPQILRVHQRQPFPWRLI